MPIRLRFAKVTHGEKVGLAVCGHFLRLDATDDVVGSKLLLEETTPNPVTN